MKRQPQLLPSLLLVAFVVLPATNTRACSSCGDTVHSDWESQGLTLETGLRLDLRYDFLNQTQIRSGTGTAHWPAGHEQELYTRNSYINVGLDYSVTPDWGVNLRVPYIDRDHSTWGTDGTDGGTSHGRQIGDIKLVGRYQGLLSEHNLGLQLGVKLPTGNTTETFRSGDIAGQPLDRGLQAGTGTTDVIAGVFYFGELSNKWSYFAAVNAQLPLNSHDHYRPGASVDLNAGVRYTGFKSFTPQIQVTPRVSAKDRLNEENDPDTGGTTVYVSPGVTVPITKNIKTYGFVQLPVYQNLNGYRLVPRWILSFGTRFEF